MSKTIIGWNTNHTRKNAVIGSIILVLFVSLLFYTVLSSGAGGSGGGGKFECVFPTQCDDGHAL